MRFPIIHPLSLALVVAATGVVHLEAAASPNEPPPDADGDVPSRGPIVEPPELLHFVEAEFPAEEAENGAEEASVVLHLSISEEGEVADVQVAESGGEAFDQAAIEAGWQLVFAPATRDGVPIPVRIGFRYDFVQRPELERKTTADFEGNVLDRFTREPVAGVLVSLDTGEETYTDADGFFRFDDIEPGHRLITLSGDAIQMVFTEETLEASHLVQAQYLVERRDEEDEDELEIVISAPRIRKQVLSTEVLSDQGRRVPGSQGDVLRVVENLPGVARAAAGSGHLVVWGAAPQDTRTYVDGVRIPRLYHDGGYRSVIHSDHVRSVELLPGGYGPMYGRGLGGIVAVELQPLDGEGFHGSLEGNGIDASVSGSARLADGLHVGLSLRRSHLDTYADLLSRPFTDRDPQEVIPIPRFTDGQLRLSYRLSAEERLELGLLGSSDRIDRSLPHDDPAFAVLQRNGVDFYRLYGRYERRAQSGAVTTVVASWGQDASTLEERYGSTPLQLDNRSDVFGLRASWRGSVESWLIAEVGVDADWSVSRLRRHGSIGAPAREGDTTTFGRPPPDQINADDWSVTLGSVAPYALLDVALLDGKLHVVPGLRLDPLVTETSRSTPKVGDLPAIATARADFLVEPRLAITYAPFSFLSLKAAAGRYHQPPLPEDLSAVFGTPTLGISRAEHWLVGGTLRLREGLSLEATGFFTRSRDLAVRSPAESPALANALESSGEGRTRGVQLLLRQDPIGPFFGWLSYSLSRSERRNAEDAPWRLFDWDQLHVLTAVASLDLGKGYELGGRFRLATGFPRTPVTGAYYDAARDRHQPLFGEHGGIRLPTFASLDLRAAKRIELGASELELYLDVQNVTNADHVEEFVYDLSFQEQGTITGFPLLPMLGARWSW